MSKQQRPVQTSPCPGRGTDGAKWARPTRAREATGSGAEPERVGVPRTDQVRLGWLTPALEPRVLNQPFPSHSLPNVLPTGCRLQLQRPSRVQEPKATRSRYSGDQFRTLTRRQGVQLGSAVLGCSKRQVLCKGRGGDLVAMNEAVLKENQGQAGLLCFLSVRPASWGREHALRMLAGNKSAWRTGAGSAEWGGQLAGRCTAGISHPLQNNHTNLHTNKQTQNPKARTFKTESSC